MWKGRKKYAFYFHRNILKGKFREGNQHGMYLKEYWQNHGECSHFTAKYNHRAGKLPGKKQSKSNLQTSIQATENIIWKLNFFPSEAKKEKFLEGGNIGFHVWELQEIGKTSKQRLKLIIRVPQKRKGALSKNENMNKHRRGMGTRKAFNVIFQQIERLIPALPCTLHVSSSLDSIRDKRPESRSHEPQ